MENLTKQQIVLLMLLVSFVTSIATGIVVVSLMNQNPTGVVQTINKVVEKTIQNVVSPIKEIQTIKETISVNSDEQIVNVIEKNSKSIVRIYKTITNSESGLNSNVLVGLGIIISDDGIIATDKSLINGEEKYFTNNEKDETFDLSLVKTIKGEQITLLKIKNDKNIPTYFSKISFSKEDLKLGQIIIYMGGETKNTVATGIVSGLSTKEIKTNEKSTSTPILKKISFIETSIPSNFTTGGLLLNLSGELVGIKSIPLDSKTNLFIPSSEIQGVLNF